MSTKYPFKYLSGSKKAELSLEDMATPHIFHAHRKLLESEPTAPVLTYMHQELVSRGCTLDPETQRWVLPDREVAS